MSALAMFAGLTLLCLWLSYFGLFTAMDKAFLCQRGSRRNLWLGISYLAFMIGGFGAALGVTGLASACPAHLPSGSIER